MSVILTTSRSPSRKTRSFGRSISDFFGWKYLTRGKMPKEYLISEANRTSSYICILDELKGNPSRLRFFDCNGKFMAGLKITVGNIQQHNGCGGYIFFTHPIPGFPLNILGDVVIPSEVPNKFFREHPPEKKAVVTCNPDGTMGIELQCRNVPVMRIKILKVIRQGEDLV
jgi:hypothetical protein